MYQNIQTFKNIVSFVFLVAWKDRFVGEMKFWDAGVMIVYVERERYFHHLLYTDEHYWVCCFAYSKSHLGECTYLDLPDSQKITILCLLYNPHKYLLSLSLNNTSLTFKQWCLMKLKCMNENLIYAIMYSLTTPVFIHQLLSFWCITYLKVE